ncbi:penicillin-binding protein 1C [Candidatus Riflebacteria bacterium]
MFKIQYCYKNSIKIFLFFLLLFCAFSLSGYLLLKFTANKITFSLPHARIILSRDSQILKVYLNRNKQLFLPVNLKNINSTIIKAIISVEDKRFFQHPGIDLFAVARALYLNLKAGKVKSGASTISMQVARLLSPAPRTLVNKIKESFKALQLEIKYSKREILELYLNLLPFGGNIVGVETAAKVYFGKTSENLELHEAATLAGIPKNPNFFNPSSNFAKAMQRRNFVLQRMLTEKKISEKEFGFASSKKDNIIKKSLPFYAPHFCELFKRGSYPGIQKSSLDLPLQKSVEQLCKNYSSILKNKNIDNLSVLVIDNRNSEVLCYVGNQDFFDTFNGGQVQGPLAKRSPGSTLKPFLYLLAFENGLLTPAEFLLDIPTHYPGLTPDNYYRKFDGQVSVRYALQNSLNIPAVRLLQELGGATFKKFLEKLGFNDLNKSSAYYGLGLILGGCEVQLLQLCNAFATIARGGIFKEVSFQPSSQKGLRLFSRGAAFLITDILRGTKGEDNLFHFSIKTGTSSNHKDAWCVGYNPDITVGVWCGNFSGESSPYLSGSKAAFPLIYKIFKLIYKKRSAPSFIRPPGVKLRTVCTGSGLRPNSFCKNRTNAYYIVAKSNNKICNVHRKYFLSPDGKTSYCSYCLGGKSYISKVFEQRPKELSRFLKKRGMLSSPIPQHYSACPYHKKLKSDVKIIQPLNGDLFYADSNAKIVVRAAADESIDRLFLFIDQKFLKSIKPEEEVFIKAEKGSHCLKVVEPSGIFVKCNFSVK